MIILSPAEKKKIIEKGIQYWNLQYKTEKCFGFNKTWVTIRYEESIDEDKKRMKKATKKATTEVPSTNVK